MFPKSLTVVGYGEIFVKGCCSLGERSKTSELLKLKDWRSELYSDVGGIYVPGLGHEVWASFIQLLQYMRHKRGCPHRQRTEGCPKACHGSLLPSLSDA